MDIENTNIMQLSLYWPSVLAIGESASHDKVLLAAECPPHAVDSEKYKENTVFRVC